MARKAKQRAEAAEIFRLLLAEGHVSGSLLSQKISGDLTGGVSTSTISRVMQDFRRRFPGLIQRSPRLKVYLFTGKMPAQAREAFHAALRPAVSGALTLTVPPRPVARPEVFLSIARASYLQQPLKVRITTLDDWETPFWPHRLVRWENSWLAAGLRPDNQGNPTLDLIELTPAVTVRPADGSVWTPDPQAAKAELSRLSREIEVEFRPNLREGSVSGGSGADDSPTGAEPAVRGRYGFRGDTLRSRVPVALAQYLLSAWPVDLHGKQDATRFPLRLTSPGRLEKEYKIPLKRIKPPYS